MSLDSVLAARILARALADDRLVALVGAGASATYTDVNGIVHRGLPTPSELVVIAQNEFNYTASLGTFNATFDAILDREGRAAVEKFLLRYYKTQESFPTPPSHSLLAWIPFSLYVTSNYDQFIERALVKENRRPFSIINNEDVVRLRRWNTPVIKYHGCVTRPSTMVAATAEYDHLQDKQNLVRSLVTTSLGGGTILVVGHGLGDSNLSKILLELTRGLGEYAPMIYVLRPPGHDGRVPGLPKEINCEVIAEDLTQFLNRLLTEFRQLRGTPGRTSVDSRWFTSSFFSALSKATVLPSETQVIDAFLEHLAEEISARTDVQGVMSDANAAVTSALEERPNYGALKRIWIEVLNLIGAETKRVNAETMLRSFIADRTGRIRQFTALGPTIIAENERILLFSQSQRVLQVLRGVPNAVQRTVHLFICECRPKSPAPYDDAGATCAELVGSNYKITVCPDVVGLNLLATKQIDKVIVGTHALFSENGPNDIYAYVNTCGTNAIAEVASRHNVPIYVIGESLKLERIPCANAEDHLHPHQENDLSDSARAIRDMATRRGPVGHLNVGYDLVKRCANTTVHLPDQVGP
jgi:translation initiation factor 2B subunit (eIF-2B alpha/beta/delta family)